MTDTKQSRPGYTVTIKGFLPADPKDPDTFVEAAAKLKALPGNLDGLEEVTVAHVFHAQHKPNGPDPEPAAAGDSHGTGAGEGEGMGAG